MSAESKQARLKSLGLSPELAHRVVDMGYTLSRLKAESKQSLRKYFTDSEVEEIWQVTGRERIPAATRKRLMDESGRRCPICRDLLSEDIVVVHHIRRRHGDNNAYDNLVVLCPNHHLQAHFGKALPPQWIRQMKQEWIEYLKGIAEGGQRPTELGSAEPPPPAQAEQFLLKYYSELRASALKRYRPKAMSYHWDLYALPIRCRRNTPQASSVRRIRCEQLLNRADQLSLLLGKPACGKTTACRRLKANPPGGLVPVDISRAQLRPGERAMAFIARVLSIGDPDFLASAERSGRFLFIADGIGERPDVRQFVRFLNLLAAELPHSRFFVTCRTGSYEEDWLPQFHRWNVCDLDNRDQTHFLNTQRKSVVQSVRDLFRRERGLRAMCGNQFVFLMVVRHVAEGRSFLPTRVGVYERFLRDFLGAWERLSALDTDSLGRVLTEVAVELRKSPSNSTLSAEARIISVLRRHLQHRSAQEIEGELKRLYRLGFIEKTEGGVCFFQETFQEFLCAKWLMSKCVFPSHFDHLKDGTIWYCGDKLQEQMQITPEISKFYKEIAGIAGFA